MEIQIKEKHLYNPMHKETNETTKDRTDVSKYTPRKVVSSGTSW